MSEEVFYVISFQTTSHSMQTEKMAKELFDVTMIPTPRDITANCGLSIRFNESNLEKIIEFHDSLNIPCDLYSLSLEAVDGKREVKKIRPV